MFLLLRPHLSDGLAAVRVDPEGPRLDHFLWIYLGDGPLHLIYQSPAGCGNGETHTLTSFHVYVFRTESARTSTSHVLPLSGCVTGAQEETQNHTRREQQSRVPHLSPTWYNRDLSTDWYTNESFKRLTCAGARYTHVFVRVALIKQHFATKTTFHSTYKFLAVLLETSSTLFHAVPSYSVNCGDVAPKLGDKMESRCRQRPLVARKIHQPLRRWTAENYSVFFSLFNC